MMKAGHLSYLIIILLLFLTPTSSFSEVKPDWLNETSTTYLQDKYLTGIGHGNSRKVAEDVAYAAISKIFSARVTSISKDYERYSHSKIESKKEISEETNVEQFTEVTTDKVLENITIADTWYDDSENAYYALAVIDRAKTGNSLKEKITSLDLEINDMVKKDQESERHCKKTYTERGLQPRFEDHQSIR